jgi:hypothetical protein
METQDLMKIGIGTKESTKLKPAKVKIVSVEFQTETKEGKKMKTPLAIINCKHPDREELVGISKIKCERTSGKLEVISLWVSLDDENKFQKSSAVSELLRFLKADSLESIYGKEIEAVEQSKEDSYLCLKAY